jgi:CRP-like cAMP-binding protein
MMIQVNRPIRNRILRSLPLSDLACIRPYLQPVLLPERLIMQEPNKPVEHISFIETGIVSLRTIAAGSILETAIVGCHGAVGVSIALCGQTSNHQSIVQIHGSALKISAADLQRSMHERPRIREHLLRYIQSLMIHSSQIALCGVRHELEKRLACWLCLMCDELDGNVIPTTHDHISMILGLRRAGITEALARFESLGLISRTRGVLEVSDRPSLQLKSCCCYNTIASAYDWTKFREAPIELKSPSEDQGS